MTSFNYKEPPLHPTPRTAAQMPEGHADEPPQPLVVDEHPLSPSQRRLLDGFEGFRMPPRTPLSSSRGVTAWLQAPVRAFTAGIQATVGALDDATLARGIERQLAHVILPPPEALRAYYAYNGADVATVRKLVAATKPRELKPFAEIFTEVVRDQRFNSTVLKQLRGWLDALVGPADSARQARKLCVRLYLTQHPDRCQARLKNLQPIFAKERAFQRQYDRMYDLLALTAKALESEPLATALYPQKEKWSHQPRRHAAFFLGSCMAGCAAYWSMSKKS